MAATLSLFDDDISSEYVMNDERWRTWYLTRNWGKRRRTCGSSLLPARFERNKLWCCFWGGGLEPHHQIWARTVGTLPQLDSTQTYCIMYRLATWKSEHCQWLVIIIIIIIIIIITVSRFLDLEMSGQLFAPVGFTTHPLTRNLDTVVTSLHCSYRDSKLNRPVQSHAPCCCCCCCCP